MAKTTVVQTTEKPARRVTARKTATKTATKAAPAAELDLRKEPATKAFFHLKSIARPKQGGRLFAHTQAVFELFGMLKGKSVAYKRLEVFIGTKALSYHVGNGNLMNEMGDVHLTKQGRDVFAKRKVNREEVDAFLSVFKTGKANAVVEVKNFQIEA